MTHGNHIRLRFILQTGLYILLLLSLSPLTAHSGPKSQGLQPAAESAADPFSRPGIKRLRPKPLPVNIPAQITFLADPLLYAALTYDSKWIAGISDQRGLSGLWLLSADPSNVVLPKQLVQAAGKLSAPAFSKDGQWIAFVGTAYDAKGDIYLIKRDHKGSRSQRLTGRDTADGAPCFSPDGKTLYFHQSKPGRIQRRLVALDLSDPKSRPQPLGIDGDGAFPSISPDGKLCAFVSFRDDPGGDIFVVHLNTKEVVPITKGANRDVFPCWSPDGQYIYFSRLSPDGDRAITANAVIFRVLAHDQERFAYPVTSGSYAAYHPVVTGSRLYFLSTQKGVSNLWALPLEGEIPNLPDADAQMKLAEALAGRSPPDDNLSLLGYYKVLERFFDNKAVAGKAGYALGMLYKRMGEPGKAAHLFRLVTESFDRVLPEAALARIALTGLETRRRWKEAITDRQRQALLKKTILSLEAIANGSEQGDLKTFSPEEARIRARSRIQQARLLMELGKGSDSLIQALGLLDNVIESKSTPRAELAEAMFLKADLFSRIGKGEKLLPAYAKVIELFPDIEEWSDSSVDKILKLSLSGVDSANQEDQIRLLARVAAGYRKSLPKLAMGAWNRMGDLYFAEGDWMKAKGAYRQVLGQFPMTTTQSAAARLALAEILFREELFRQALDLYETEMASRTYEDRLYELARAGYVRKSLAAAEFQLRLGEVPSAQNTFIDLIRDDYSLVQAHRGYIKCAAAKKEIDTALARYRARLEQDPDDPVSLYATGLCLSYKEGRDNLEEAESLIKRAIQIQGDVEYFHQTLGYLSEVMETVHERPDGLEAALESYQKAYFLNNPEKDPANAAHLSLNMGNIYFLLGHFTKAFENYSRRLGSGIPFDKEETEILFYRRFGASAFQIGEQGRPIQAYSQAIDLIEKRIDPKRASEVLGNLNSYIFDRIITPALKRPESAKKAKEMAQQQAALNRRLFEVTGRPVAPPPDPGWIRYKEEMASILSDQTTLIPDLTPLIQDKPSQTAETLSYMTKRANEALQFPEGLIHLKAEMLDRLGLAFQAAREWGQARQAFERAYELNEGLGLVKNLSANQRSIAYNAYMEAGTLSGEDRKQLLETSYKGFEHLIELVHRYGAVGQEKKEAGRGKGREGLISVSLDLSLDRVSSSQAMYGFSPDQEVRLAQAFMARIKTELGQLIPAQNAILKQLNNYPVGRSIPDEDLYGVSLLYHRAGHLSYAGRKPIEAFNHFMRSARISLRLKNPVSAALNVMNMAKVLSGVPPENPEKERCYAQLMDLDRKTTRLLDQSSEVVEALIIPSYHNTMGVFILEMDPKERDPSPEIAVRTIKKQEQAYMHFSLGHEGLNNDSASTNRGALELLAAIHLNMAEIAGLWGQTLKARDHLENALKIARKGLLPRYEWRALAGLGQLKEALAVLETVSILKAECAPGEIISQFSPSVSALINEGEAEEAFNLLERLSEMERVHRLRPLIIGEIPPAERSLLMRVYPRLIKIKQLSAGLARAKKADRSYLSKRLSREKKLLDMDMGTDRERLPSPARLSGSKKMQDWIMILLGLALHAEDVADSAVKKGMGSDTIPLQQQYKKLMKQYSKGFKKAKAIASTGENRWVISIFGPDPVEAIDLMEELPEGSACIRIIPLSHKAPGRLGFVVTPEEITVRSFNNQSPFDLPGKGPHIIASEDHSALPADMSYALSATHLVRSIRNRKPFKRRVLTLPPQQKLPEYFDVKALPITATNREIIDGLIGRDVILFNRPIYEAGSVPTRPGQIPTRSLTMEMENGRTFSLNLLSDHLSGVSLAVLPGASERDVYPLGHLFSLFGVPTLLLPGQSKGDSHLIEPFFKAYETDSANKALNVASAKIKPGAKTGAKPLAKNDGGWIQVGYWGMTPEEARVFSQRHFKAYVKKGLKAFKSKHPIKALSFFENALDIATEINSFSRFIPQLHKYARESAYASARYQKAIFHAQKLVDILASARPDSKEYAEALLRLGLVEARAEKYDQAIPTLEKSAAIMADLELGPRQIAALNDLAIVLENATHYDRALEQFESAASLSRGMDKEELLAKQYMRIGRIYDLRLSSYAKAKQFYTKAYSIYERLRKQNKMAQALLDIGRCCRLLGNFREAGEDYKQALGLIGTKGDHLRLRANILMEQANNAWYQARYQTAFGLQRKVIDLADQNEWPLEKVMALNTSGLTWWTLGDHERALRELEDALSLARTLRIRRDEVATSLNNIGLVYREMGELKKGLNALEEALAIDREIKSKWAIAYDLKNIALTYLEMEKPEKAAALFEEALVTASGIGNKINEAKILLGYGDALASAGRDAEANKAFEKALKLSRSMALRETEWPALYGIAKLRLKEGKKKEARGLLFEALSVIEGMRGEIKIDRLKDKFISNKLGVYETLVSLLLDMGKTREAFDIAERSRARNFIDLLGSQRLTLKGTVDQDLYDRQKTIQSRIDEHQALLAQAGNKDERKAYQRDLKRLEDQFQDLMSEIQTKNPELATLVSVNPLDLTEIQALLEPDVAVLVYYTLPDEILCWYITAHSVELFRTPLGRDTLGKTVLNYRRMLQNLEPLEDQSRELYSWLLAPIMPKLGSARVLGIVPHGILHHLSFATLYDGNNYVADRIPLFYLPSASLLRYTLERRKTDKNMRVLAIGNPDLNNPALDLPFAEREVSTIHWNFPDTTLLTRDKATESWVIGHMGDFGIIHLASHGEFDAVNPLFSAIKLTKDAHNDGDLKASETFGLKIDADLVMLSACQTGLGKVTNGDDVIGLNRAFLYAGTHSIISSLWRVSDISTAMLVKQFYREYKTQNKANSLRRAILHVKNRYPHPGYWGAFLLVGDYD